MAQAAQLFIQLLIVYSVITLSLETVPELSKYNSFFHASEAVVVGIFTIEYVIRWASSENKLRYPFRPLAIIDLLAILPFYVQFGFDLRSVRAVRLLRIFRLLKLGRYSRALQNVGEAVRRAGPELVGFGLVVLIILMLSSMALYYAEHDAQPHVYRSIPESMWWAVVTLTTVGYGDIYPITGVGKFVAAFVMLCGVAVIAIPTGVISSHMTDIIREARAEKQHRAKSSLPREPGP